MLEVIDLSHTIEQGMPVFPGSLPVKISKGASIAREGFNELLLSISGHTGTHIDTGRHLSDAWPDVSSLGPETFTGKGIVIDCTKAGAILDRELFTAEKRLGDAEFVLLMTGWSRYWKSEVYFQSFPVLAIEAANYLSSFPLKGIGIDCPGFDTADSKDFHNHLIFLSKGILLIENLTNLQLLPSGSFTFSCFPLKISGGDGSPVRAAGIIS